LTKALNALLKHIKTPSVETPNAEKKLQLLSDPESTLLNQPLFLQLTTKQILTAESTVNLKPLTIPLPHSPYPPTSTALVITKDPHDPFSQKTAGNPRVQQCLGMGAIRKSFNSYEQLRRLRDGDVVGEEPALVLADEKIVPSLPKVLGKAFYKTPRTTPIAVAMTPATIAKVVDEAFGKSYVRKNAGNCVAIRIGYAAMSVDSLVENCVAAWDRCVLQNKLVKNGVDGVRGGFVKSGSSVALPVWQTAELYSQENILDGPVVKEVKSKAQRKLMKPDAEDVKEVEVEGGKKRSREDDVEKSFESRRARKLAKQGEAAKVKATKAVKV
jgi:ribosome biogenesis protein UTP30